MKKLLAIFILSLLVILASPGCTAPEPPETSQTPITEIPECSEGEIRTATCPDGITEYNKENCVEGKWIQIKYFRDPCEPAPEIKNFEECAGAGYPVMESYPRQCRTPDGKLFVEEIEPVEKTHPLSPTEESTEKTEIDWSRAQEFTDPQGDFWLGEGSPPQIIEFPPSDIRKVLMTIDGANIYLRFEVDGEIPRMPQIYGDDTIRILSMALLMDTDRDRNTGKAMNYQGADLAMEAWFGSPAQAEGEFFQMLQYAFYDPAAPEGIDAWNPGKLQDGGVGHDYLTMEFPISALGLEKGSSVDVIIFVEVESDQYHHFARDVVGGEKQWEKGVLLQ